MASVEFSTQYGRKKIATLKENHPLQTEAIDRRVQRYLVAEHIAPSDDEFANLLENEHDPRPQHPPGRPLKGKKVRGIPPDDSKFARRNFNALLTWIIVSSTLYQLPERRLQSTVAYPACTASSTRSGLLVLLRTFQTGAVDRGRLQRFSHTDLAHYPKLHRGTCVQEEESRCSSN